MQKFRFINFDQVTDIFVIGEMDFEEKVTALLL